MTRALWSTGKAMITEIGFCVLKRLLKMMKKGFYGIVLIKLRRYWPKGVNTNSINDYFRSKILAMWDV